MRLPPSRWRDLRSGNLGRRQLLATVVRLLDKTLIRIGNDEYARANASFGLTTLRRRHVHVAGSTLHFTFRGKSGIEHSIAINDLRLARIVQRCQDLPGQEPVSWLVCRKQAKVTAPAGPLRVDSPHPAGYSVMQRISRCRFS